MSERRPDDVLPVRPRRLDARTDRLDDVQDPRHRMTAVERRLADVRGDVASMAARPGRIGTRLDRMDRRVDLPPADGGRP